MKKSRQNLRLSDKDLKNFVEKNGVKSIHGSEEETLKQTLLSLGIPDKFFNKAVKNKKNTKTTEDDIQTEVTLTPVKKQINKFKIIMESLNSCEISTKLRQTDTTLDLFLWFTGARVLTLNELFSTLQSRKYEIFIYKKKWKQLIQEAVLLNKDPIPLFNGPTRIYLYRRGKKLIDLDSFQTIFKYAIDGLRQSGIIPEDNPNIVVEIIPIQEKGETSVGIRVERLYDWDEGIQVDTYNQWFNQEEPKK